MNDTPERLHLHMREHERLERDPLVSERVCGHDVCGCVLNKGNASAYCSDYCKGEGREADGRCQCGHIPCA